MTGLRPSSSAACGRIAAVWLQETHAACLCPTGFLLPVQVVPGISTVPLKVTYYNKQDHK
jgi:hypothetical protein